MKETGIVRPVDMLGRVVLPVELRRTLGIAEKDLVEIFTQDETIILKKHVGNCVFCGATENLEEYKGKNICQKCKEELR